MTPCGRRIFHARLITWRFASCRVIVATADGCCEKSGSNTGSSTPPQKLKHHTAQVEKSKWRRWRRQKQTIQQTIESPKARTARYRRVPHLPASAWRHIRATGAEGCRRARHPQPRQSVYGGCLQQAGRMARQIRSPPPNRGSCWYRANGVAFRGLSCAGANSWAKSWCPTAGTLPTFTKRTPSLGVALGTMSVISTPRECSITSRNISSPWSLHRTPPLFVRTPWARVCSLYSREGATSLSTA
mmetsp:Transcript_40639/g.65422  ORF Transcript_40639/g.65422 Transcript_40639/m.65422 type:complete len:244 (+) Transcript_40639:167-898(+)